MREQFDKRTVEGIERLKELGLQHYWAVKRLKEIEAEMERLDAACGSAEDARKDWDQQRELDEHNRREKELAEKETAQ
jgi:hypothetical protein